ncbi:hypothetical protein BV20DRAFT_969462 [Pilatotrama ljubarskyi]|nr:hypothetical protein BV20DRAFT_969462 [Pilatotrama ljubarskyi]
MRVPRVLSFTGEAFEDISKSDWARRMSAALRVSERTEMWTLVIRPKRGNSTNLQLHGSAYKRFSHNPPSLALDVRPLETTFVR